MAELRPSSTVVYGAVGGAGIGPLIVWLIEQAFHTQIPPLLAVSLGAAITSLVSYALETRKRNGKPPEEKPA